MAAFLATWFLCSVGFCSPQVQVDSTQAQPWQNVTAIEFKKIVETDSTVLLLDVRSQSEYDRGHLAGAHLFPYNQLSDRSKELPVDHQRVILVYCHSGHRSQLAAETLVKLGYKKVVNLSAGFSEWKRCQLPIEVTPPPVSKPPEQKPNE